MIETVESRLKKLETKRGAGGDPVEFRVFLVEIDAEGDVYRTQWPAGKRKKVDGTKVGIEPHLAIVPPSLVPQVAPSAPPVAIAAPEPHTEAEIVPVDADGHNHKRPGETEDQYMRRIRAQADELERQFDALK